MKDEGVGQINMYDTFLGLVPKESGIELHILNTWQTWEASSQLNGALTKINTQKNLFIFFLHACIYVCNP